MRWVWGPALLAATAGLQAQGMPASLELPARALLQPDPAPTLEQLPDAPGFSQVQGASSNASLQPVKTCVKTPAPANATPVGTPDPGCAPIENLEDPYKQFQSSKRPQPLTSMQKGKLAIRAIKDPFNALTILGNSTYTVASDAHTVYGPGLKGFGREVGYTYLQDATGDFFGTFAIPSLTHEDPRYHRMPHRNLAVRLVHAVSRTVIAESDSGRPMPNYATLLTNPICAEISNLYVPGVATNAPSTVKRILTGYATDPIGNVIAEFLPDVASHIHVQVLFVQRILNQVSAPANGSVAP